MNLDRIEAILRLLQRQVHVGEISVDGQGWRLQARRAPGAPMPPFMETPVSADEPAEPERVSIRAGQVGVFRAPRRPLSVGDEVERGAAVGQIDSMRILNPVVAEMGGRVEKILVEDGEPVEYGQELFVLAPGGR
jgi:biotin carboxyl carrier protein